MICLHRALCLAILIGLVGSLSGCAVYGPRLTQVGSICYGGGWFCKPLYTTTYGGGGYYSQPSIHFGFSYYRP